MECADDAETDQPDRMTEQTALSSHHNPPCDQKWSPRRCVVRLILSQIQVGEKLVEKCRVLTARNLVAIEKRQQITAANLEGAFFANIGNLGLPPASHKSDVEM